MKRVGITGNIGSGKTFVSKIFAQFGIPVYYSDMHAKRLMQTHPVLKEKLIESFGEATYNSDGSLNKSLLAQRVFNDSKQLSVLNSLVHPIVMNDFEAWCRHYSGQKPYVLLESAILAETGLYKAFDKIIGVVAPIKVRIERVMSRDKSGLTEAQARIKSQGKEKDIREISDYIIVNNGNKALLPQVLTIHEKLCGSD